MAIVDFGAIPLWTLAFWRFNTIFTKPSFATNTESPYYAPKAENNMTTRPATFRKFTDCAMRGFSAFATFLALALMAWILYTVVLAVPPAHSAIA